MTKIFFSIPLIYVRQSCKPLNLFAYFCYLWIQNWWIYKHMWKCSGHDDVIKWKHFPHYWSFVRGIHRPPVNSPHKGQWRGALMFSLICTWINSLVNNLVARDLRCHRAHYDVTVMFIVCISTLPWAVCTTVESLAVFLSSAQINHLTVQWNHTLNKIDIEQIPVLTTHSKQLFIYTHHGIFLSLIYCLMRCPWWGTIMHLGRHWFRYWLFAWLAPNHYPISVGLSSVISLKHISIQVPIISQIIYLEFIRWNATYLGTN